MRALAAQSDAGVFAVNQTGAVRTPISFDYELDHSRQFWFILSARDTGSNVVNFTVNCTLIDMNDKPVLSSVPSVTIKQSIEYVGRITRPDPVYGGGTDNVTPRSHCLRAADLHSNFTP